MNDTKQLGMEFLILKFMKKSENKHRVRKEQSENMEEKSAKWQDEYKKDIFFFQAVFGLITEW